LAWHNCKSPTVSPKAAGQAVNCQFRRPAGLLSIAAVAKNDRLRNDLCMASPVLNYEFGAPPQIVFGWGRRSEIARLGRPLGRRALLVSGSRQLESHGLIDELEARLAAECISPVRLGTISHEPLVEDVDRFTESLLKHSAPNDGDFKFAIGGG
jgi:hypothetical protein